MVAVGVAVVVAVAVIGGLRCEGDLWIWPLPTRPWLTARHSQRSGKGVWDRSPLAGALLSLAGLAAPVVLAPDAKQGWRPSGAGTRSGRRGAGVHASYDELLVNGAAVSFGSERDQARAGPSSRVGANVSI